MPYAEDENSPAKTRHRRFGNFVRSYPGIKPLKSIGKARGPWLDMAFGFYAAVAYYYYPGFHEPGTSQALGINKRLWESLDASDRRLFEPLTACEYVRSLAEFNANNAKALRTLKDEGVVQIRKFDDALLRQFIDLGREVVSEMGDRDDLSKRIYKSYQSFRESIMDWSEVAERAFVNARKLP
jgi:TRAP-type mannitol/chloroaromatic compound transport system substrate-binding protein